MIYASIVKPDPFVREDTEVSCRDRIGYASQMDGTVSFPNREIGRALRASCLKEPFPVPPNMRMKPKMQAILVVRGRISRNEDSMAERDEFGTLNTVCPGL